MSHTRLWTSAAIIALLIVTGFLISVPHTRDAAMVALPQVATGTPTVAVRDSFKKGLHTITGSIQVPNACTLITAQASLLGDASSPNGIALELSYPMDSGICLQTETKATFQTSISAPAGLPLVVTVNGVAATTTTP